MSKVKVKYDPYEAHERPSVEYLKDTYFEPYRGEILVDELIKRRELMATSLDKSSTRCFADPINAIKEHPTSLVDFSGDKVCFGQDKELSSQEHKLLYRGLESLKPWRKGPFDYFGVEVDAEWRSNLKWDRIAPYIPDLKNKKVLDIGCNNLYYMYRMLNQDPWFILGIDPMVRYYFHHQLNQKFYKNSKVNFDLLGVDDLDLFPKFFDVVFFMGILYHRRNPVQTLENLGASMRRGGTLILETCGIAGDDPLCLFPDGRYMKAPGYWFLPTASAMINMLKRTGFTNIELFDSFLLKTHEQRQTPWSEYQSLEDFLDPEDQSKTVEGYPGPVRIYIKAEKR